MNILQGVCGESEMPRGRKGRQGERGKLSAMTYNNIMSEMASAFIDQGEQWGKSIRAIRITCNTGSYKKIQRAAEMRHF